MSLGDLCMVKYNFEKCNFEFSCLSQLMRQIDVMVNAKKVEWDNQLQTMKVQLEKRNAELALLRNTLEQRNQEVCGVN